MNTMFIINKLLSEREATPNSLWPITGATLVEILDHTWILYKICFLVYWKILLEILSNY